MFIVNKNLALSWYRHLSDRALWSKHPCDIRSHFFLRGSPQWALVSSFTRFLDHTRRHITVGRTPLDEWSAHRRDLYPTTHNTPYRQTSMPPVGFEPTISAGEWPQTYALDRAATGTGIYVHVSYQILSLHKNMSNFTVISPLHKFHNINLEFLSIHLSELFEGESPAMQTWAKTNTTLAGVHL